MAPKNSNMFVIVPRNYIRTFGGERLGPNLFSTKKTPKNGVFESFFAFFLPGKLPNSQKTFKNFVFEVSGYI